MKIKTILIEIYLDKKTNQSDLELRHLLVDTIENRDLGEVVEETSSIDMLEVIVEVLASKKIEEDLKSLLLSLGFSDYNIHDITQAEE